MLPVYCVGKVSLKNYKYTGTTSFSALWICGCLQPGATNQYHPNFPSMSHFPKSYLLKLSLTG
ncbi:unnamed protein product [Brugia timori]|uniref:Ovule protein n=1 Tax=Brugia timori TaxID=42155 RepID=A0A0R3QC02_9BILA|nr:unnamed protein product [Brugia timori]